MAASLREQIKEGALKVGDYLLPESELAKAFSVSSRVVREALARLEAEGLISRQQGRGTLVCAAPESTDTPRKALKNIGVIFQSRMRDAETYEFFDSLQQTFQRHGYSTAVLVTNQDPAREVAIVEQMVKDGVSGIVLFSCHDAGSSSHLQAAMDAGVKVCAFDHYFPGLNCNFVGINDRLAGYDATAHLINSGVEELILINSASDWTTHMLRQEGFVDAISKLVPQMRHHILSVPMFQDMEAQLKKGLSPLLRQVQGRVGVLAWWDRAARFAMDCLREEGLSVPRDAGVVGFSNDIESAMAEIPLTTMQIPQEEIARLCAYLLIDQIEHPEVEAQHIALRSPLIIRESCGCYPAARKRMGGVEQFR